ncbi:flavin reductase family protein [Helicobacter sp. T3_23-1056]
MIIDFEFSSTVANYRLLSNTITPRPIAWVSSINANGVVNLAPFSFFGVVSSVPPIFSLCFSPKSDGTPKDTLQNLKSTKCATISLVMVDFLERLEQSASEVESHKSEASVFGIELNSVEPSYPPVPKGVRVAYFCELREILDLSAYNVTALLQAKKCFVDDEIYKEDLRFLPPHLGRVGKYYLQAKEVIDPNIKD